MAKSLEKSSGFCWSTSANGQQAELLGEDKRDCVALVSSGMESPDFLGAQKDTRYKAQNHTVLYKPAMQKTKEGIAASSSNHQ